MGKDAYTLPFTSVVLLAASPFVGLVAAAPTSAIRIGAEARLPEHPRSAYLRYVNWRPADGEVVDLNPPRFSWPYWPDPPLRPEPARYRFIFQIASDPTFHRPLVNVTTPFNFYNTLPALRGVQKWYWRIGYDSGNSPIRWSDGRSFSLASGAVEWDRSALAQPPLAQRGHPRILFHRENLEAIRRLRETDPASKAAWEWMVRHADRTLQQDWWMRFPPTDRDPEYPKAPFYSIAHDLAVVAFVWKLSGDPRYIGVKERAVTLASYPKGGRASPEGLGGDGNEDATQTNEFLALLFDWLYEDLDEPQRQTMIRSLEWRIDHWMNTFSWNARGPVKPTSLSGCVTSHQYEGSMDSAVMGLALYEHSPIAKEWFDLILNYLIGVTNGFGFDEAWNEGPGYGNSKMKWLMNATLYFDTALPEARLGRNPYYRAIGDFFARITPVGLSHSPWGNLAANERHVSVGRVANFRKLAYLTGEGRFLANWQESGGKEFSTMRPFIEYVLPHYYPKPKKTFESDFVRLFPIEGWVTAASRPPSARADFQESVGIIFQCRPRGGYSHSFHSDGAFQIHAYGQCLNHGGGSTANQDAYAYHTMSHDTILVDGLGQAQPSLGMTRPWYGRIAAFRRGEGFVYFAGDATHAYPHQPGQYRRWGLPLSEVYQQRDVSHLQRFLRHVLFLRNRYFVLFDDLKTTRPARFTWLYHILPKDPFRVDGLTVRYQVGEVQVVLAHLAYPEELVLEDRQEEEALVNPFTGEDYREQRKAGPLAAHNLWITNREPKTDHHFLAVIYPYRTRDPDPRIERLDDWTVRVDNDVITFNPAVAQRHRAHIVVDPAALR